MTANGGAIAEQVCLQNQEGCEKMVPAPAIRQCMVTAAVFLAGAAAALSAQPLFLEPTELLFRHQGKLCQAVPVFVEPPLGAKITVTSGRDRRTLGEESQRRNRYLQQDCRLAGWISVLLDIRRDVALGQFRSAVSARTFRCPRQTSPRRTRRTHCDAHGPTRRTVRPRNPGPGNMCRSPIRR